MDADVPYALDLSHLTIVAVTERSVDVGLVRALVGTPRFIEIHVSGNDGTGDQHQQLDQLPWW